VTGGRWRKSKIRQPARQRRDREGTATFLGKGGYTLIELIVVMVLVGIVFTFAAPRIRQALLNDSLKAVARHLVAVIHALRNEAVSRQEGYTLYLDLTSNRLWSARASMTPDEKALAQEQAYKLPPDVRIRDVWIKEEGKTVEGEARILFTPRGYTQVSAVHLRSQDGREVTLELTPFMGRVTVLDKYVAYD